MKWSKRIINFFISSNKYEKQICFQFIIGLIYSLFIIKVIPLKLYYKKFLKFGVHEYADLQLFSQEISFFRRIIRNCPFNISCLTECIAVHTYFKRKGIIVPIHVGINTEDHFIAHAWYDNKEFNRKFSHIKL